MTAGVPTPDRVMRLINGYWATGVLAAACTHRVFTHLAAGAGDAAELAAAAGISERGAQTLLDGLVSIGLVDLEGGRYGNTAEAATYLVEDTPVSLARFARLKLTHMGALADLPEVVRRGGPVAAPVVEVANNPHWEEIVRAIAPQSVPAARLATEVLGIAGAGPLAILDVGGGSGIYSATWLAANPDARATQLDWQPINAIARRLLAERGLDDRFTTVDGDFHHTGFGAGAYDIAVYSHIAHQESPEANIEVFTRLRQALKPGGALVVCDYIVDDDRSGPAFPLVFASEMLLKSQHGSTWRRADYHAWLTKAGFDDIGFHHAPPATLAIAR
jgi:2-polyprenyl-3-methyl-5-hydroxy-6-metoxy-1,4-benzoquinol methylase